MSLTTGAQSQPTPSFSSRSHEQHQTTSRAHPLRTTRIPDPKTKPYKAQPWRRLTLKVTKDATARTIRRNIARLDLARLLGKPEPGGKKAPPILRSAGQQEEVFGVRGEFRPLQR